MKKILPLFTFILFVSVAVAQDNPSIPKKKQPIDMSNRPNDHFVIQLGVANWSGLPDTINKQGLSKSFNVYLMFDFPFKTNPKLSIAVGPGIGSDHIVFSKTYIGIRDRVSSIHFTNVSDTNNYKKTKLATVYFEAPLELRYSSNPLTGNGFKLALGVKVGTMLNAHTRNTKYETKTGGSLDNHVLKESSKQFFNRNRLCLIGRVGYGHFSIFGSYQVSSLFKTNAGPDVKPYSIGITLSGL